MKKCCLILAVVLMSLVAFAQDAPKAEVFGGYQYTNVDLKGLADRQNFNGWNLDVAGRVGKNVSLVADLGGAYKSESGVSAKIHTIMFGPRFSATSGKLSPFVQTTIGFAHSSLSGGGESAGNNSFAWAAGGGVDYTATKSIAIRVAKFEYLLVRDSGTNFNNFRIASGVVFKF